MSHRSLITRVVGLAAALFLLAPIGAASAASSPAPSATPQPIPSNLAPSSAGGSDKVTFSVAPANASGPDGRSGLTYNRITAGSVVEDFIGISNFSDQPENFTLGAADAYTNSSGSLTLNQDDQRSTDIGSWVSFTHTEVSIPAHARLNEPIKVTVPANAKPGDHTGGVYAEFKITASSGGTGSFNQDHRVAVPLYLSVPGKVVTGLAISSLTTDYHGTLNPIGQGSAHVSYTITNTGNVNLTGTQHVAITGLYGVPLASIKAPDVPELMPGKSYQVNLSVPDVFPLAWMTTKVTITPKQTHPNSAGPSPSTIAKVSKSAGFWGTPILLLVLIVLIAAGVWGGRYWFRYRRALTDDRLFDAVEQARRETAARLTGAGSDSATGGA